MQTSLFHLQLLFEHIHARLPVGGRRLVLHHDYWNVLPNDWTLQQGIQRL